jgi:hypothetical protein
MSQAINQYSTAEFLSAMTLDQVDETVAEVFGVMLGLGVEASTAVHGTDGTDGTNDRTGLVVRGQDEHGRGYYHCLGDAGRNAH